MPTLCRRWAAAATITLFGPFGALAAADSAAAFQVGPSPDFAGCSIWLNDKGEPLRNRSGREIGRKVPCAGEARGRDTYETLPGEAAGTLVLRDATHHVECILVLAPGSATVVIQKVCQPFEG